MKSAQELKEISRQHQLLILESDKMLQASSLLEKEMVDYIMSSEKYTTNFVLFYDSDLYKKITELVDIFQFKQYLFLLGYEIYNHEICIDGFEKWVTNGLEISWNKDYKIYF